MLSQPTIELLQTAAVAYLFIFRGVQEKLINEVELTLAPSVSLMKTDLSCPFISKNTSLSPVGVKSSAIARSLIARVLPFSIVT